MLDTYLLYCHLLLIMQLLSLMELSSEVLGKLKEDVKSQTDGLNLIELLVSKELRSDWHDNFNDSF